VRVETVVVAALKAWWPDGWDRGRRTAATARPRVGAVLPSVGHRLKNGMTESMMPEMVTDRATLEVINS
jgi:hypothetical protein